MKSTRFWRKRSREINADERPVRPFTGRTAVKFYISGQGDVLFVPADARKAGIGMVHQHFMLIQSQTVWENMILGLDGLPCSPRRDIRPYPCHF